MEYTMNFDIDATLLKTQLEKLILEKRLEKIFIVASVGKVIVRYIFLAKKDRESDLKDLLLLIVKQNLSIIEKGLFSAALYADARGIRTKLMEGVSQIETSIKQEGVLPVIIARNGKIYDRHKNEIDLTPLFEEVKKYLPPGLDRVGEEEE